MARHAQLALLLVGGIAALVGTGMASYTILAAVMATIQPVPDPARTLQELAGVAVPEAAAPLALAAAGAIALMAGFHHTLPEHTPRHRAAKTMHAAALYLQAVGYIAATLAAAAGTAATTILALSTTATGWALWLLAAIILAYAERTPQTLVYTITVLLANPLSLGIGYPLAAVTAWLTWGR